MAVKGPIRVATLAAASLMGGAMLASAQTCPTSPNYSPDFTAAGTNPSCLAFNGTGGSLPSIVNTPPVLRLTPAVGSLAASAWYTTAQNVASGFSTTFSFQVGGASPANTSDGDGFAFVIQNSSAGTAALGADGCSIGFGGANCGSSGGITNSLAIEFNTYNNGAGVDPSNSDVTIQNCGIGAVANSPAQTCSLRTHDLTLDNPSVHIADDKVHVATVTYAPTGLFTCGTSHNQACYALDVVLDGVDLFPGGGVPFDITTLGLNNSTAFVGFTAASGAANDDQDILSWIFAPSGPVQTGYVTPTQTDPTTFYFNGGFAVNVPTSGFDFTAKETTSNQTVQMVVNAVPIDQASCNALVQKSFPSAECFAYQNGGPNGVAAVMFEVTCPATGSCGSNTPFFADLGTDFSFDCANNVPLQCGVPFSTPFTFGFPNLTLAPLYLPSVGFLKGEGPDTSHPCTPNPDGSTPLFASNQIESFSLGDTSGGAKGGSGGTTSCWVMTYETQDEAPTIAITQPGNGASYMVGQIDATTVPQYNCTALNAGSASPVGPYLSIASCTATDTPGGIVTVNNISQFDTTTPGQHTFTVQAQDSATNTSQQSVTYYVDAPPAISGVSSATFEVGTPGSVGFSATGYPVPAFTAAGALPAGVTFVDNKNGTATLSGNASSTGVFPITITAQNGIGSAATLKFTLTSLATAPTASGKCNGIYNGTFKGNLTVSAGQTCTFVAGGVTGNIVENGGQLVLTNAAIGGSIQVSGGTFSVGPGTTIKGNFSVLALAKSTVTSQVCGSSIGGNLQILTTSVPINIGFSSGCAGNIITGNLNVTANNATIAMYGNTIGGSLLDVANSKPTQVFSNNVKGLLTCTADSGITGGGNTASLKIGQCAKF